ncbi:hypothetical protein MIND_00013500 [Mycena indigotica]|uniref:Uncharacterized protein n=1 Tax=Mycena indigotica TaxID=2126181 RepID=A0A8H6WJX2_9AGAR|nr:uncharacterized protein MIND_00013500 [Mycena indigotica]KAF7314994.1 hypothetical protein MIND_00013500 [Mycena indigotica]
MSTWDASLKSLKDKAPAAAEAAATSSLDERVAAADKEFASSVVPLLLWADGSIIYVTTNNQQGQGLCGKAGDAAFKGFQTGWLYGTYTLVVTSTTAQLLNANGLVVYNGIGYASPTIRGSWQVSF